MPRHQSYWNATAPASSYAPLSGELEVDVAVIGGGIVGVTTARMLKDRGLKVALVEARRVGEEVTGKSTATVTSQHNITYTTIKRKFGDGADNPWLKLFDATRIKPIAGGAEFVKGNAEVAAHLVCGYLSSKPKDYAALAPGQGAVLKVDGHNVAAFRDEDGRVQACSAVCPHMGCLVGWNETDRSWDCPCHGSRFALDGGVIHGPAVTALQPVNVDESVDA